MNLLKKAFTFFVFLIIFLMFMIMPARSAVVVADISVTEFNSLISTNQAAWSVLYRGGSTLGGTNNEEIRLARNMATPEAGGGSNTLIGNLTWSRPTELEILIDGAGNISARAGSTTVSSLDFAVTNPFNQVLIWVFDNSVFGASDLQNIDVNGFAVRNMFADGAGPTHGNDILSVHDFGSQAPFSWTGVWDPDSFPVQNEQYVWIIGLNNPAIPEPSSFILTTFLSFGLLRRKR